MLPSPCPFASIILDPQEYLGRLLVAYRNKKQDYGPKMPSAQQPCYHQRQTLSIILTKDRQQVGDGAGERGDHNEELNGA